jgi:hypothetical protein
MEIKKHYIIRRWRKAYKVFGDATSEINVPEYYKGYFKWTDKFEKAKMYTKGANANKALQSLPDSGTTNEILFITTTIETMTDIVEKELLDLS